MLTLCRSPETPSVDLQKHHPLGFETFPISVFLEDKSCQLENCSKSLRKLAESKNSIPIKTGSFGGFLKWWVFPPNHPLKNRVFHYFHHPFWGYHHLRKHPFGYSVPRLQVSNIPVIFVEVHFLLEAMKKAYL